MPKYVITAKREIHYEFNIQADSEQEVLDEVNRIESTQDVEEYAYNWFPLEITEIEEDIEQRSSFIGPYDWCIGTLKTIGWHKQGVKRFMNNDQAVKNFILY